MKYQFLKKMQIPNVAKYKIRILIFILLNVVEGGYAQNIRNFRLNMSFDDYNINETQNDEYFITSVRNNCFYKSDSLLPALPYITIKVLIGQNEEYHDYQIQSTDSLISQNVYLVPNPQAIPLSEFSPNTKSHNEVLYKDHIYPSHTVEYIGTQFIDGFKTLSFAICPFKYNADTKTLFYNSDITLSVKTTNTAHTNGRSYTVGNNMRKIVIPDIINANELDELYSIPHFDFRSINTYLQTSYKYLIITNSSLKPAFEELSLWKTLKGVRTKVLTTEEINLNYSGTDLQEKIKRALIDYYNGTHSGLEFVLLGGDVNIVPARMCFIKNGNSIDKTPADLYYACLDDITWDGNNNGEYAEVEDGIDYLPEIFVSRIPVQNISDASSFVNRVINYERNPKNDFYHNNILMGGCKIKSYLTAGGDTISDAQEMGEYTYTNYIKDYWDGNRVRFYDTSTDFSLGASYNFTATNIQEQLSKGYTFIDMSFHGNDQIWTTESGPNYSLGMASSLINEGYSIIFTNACNTNAFDRNYTCLSEALMRNHLGGILGYIGASRSNFFFPGAHGAPSNYLNQDFYEFLFTGKEASFGRLFQKAKNHAYQVFGTSEVYNWLHLTMNALGDPEMPIFISAPKHFGDIEVVEDLGTYKINTHLDSYRICITHQTDSTIYIVQDNCRSASMRILNGTFIVYVTKPGYIPCKLVIGKNINVQNESIRGDVRYFSTNNISMGSEVSTEINPGPVSVEIDGNIIIKRKREVLLDKGFSIKEGGTFEIQ